MTKDKRPIRVIRTKGPALYPATVADQEVLNAIKAGDTVEITIKRRRSLPQMHAYWQMLQNLVDATDRFPTTEHAHSAVKFACGLTTPMKTMTGEVYLIPDSTAFDKMDAPTFRAYFDRAHKLIIEHYGFDPLETQEKAA